MLAQDNLDRFQAPQRIVMGGKNRYCHHSHISERKFREIVRYFAMDLEASKIAELTGVSRITVNRILNGLRSRLALWSEQESLPWSPDDPVMEDAGAKDEKDRDEGPQVNECRRGGPAIMVLGIVKKEGRIFTRILTGMSRKTLKAIAQGKMPLESVNSGEGASFSSLVDLEQKKLYRLSRTVDESAANKPAINSVENFWGNAKMRLSKFRGLHRKTLYLHLKETEFRFNNRKENLYELFLNKLKQEPLKFSSTEKKK